MDGPPASPQSDDQTSVEDLRAAVRQFVAAREWDQFHTPKSLAMSIAIEAAEIMEHFQWLDGDASREYVLDVKQKAQVADELADVLIYALCFANSCDIDVSQAIRAKLAHSETRYPPEEKGLPIKK